MAHFPKPLKDVNTSDVREMLFDSVKGALKPELDQIRMVLERIAKALEKQAGK